MSTCETCWADAYSRMLADPSKSQTEHYIDLLAERKDHPCLRPAETVRAWVARGESRSAHLVLCVAEPKRTERGLSGVAFATLPHSWFPTLAPGECWPVEIRRVTEEAP